MLVHRFLTNNPIFSSLANRHSFSMAHPSSGWPPRNWLIRKSPAVADGAQLCRYWTGSWCLLLRNSPQHGRGDEPEGVIGEAILCCLAHRKTPHMPRRRETTLARSTHPMAGRMRKDGRGWSRPRTQSEGPETRYGWACRVEGACETGPKSRTGRPRSAAAAKCPCKLLLALPPSRLSL